MVLSVAKVIKLILLLLIPSIFFMIIKTFIKEFSFVDMRDRFYEEVSEKLTDSKLGYFNKDRIEKFLKMNGVKISLSAEKYILIKFLLSISATFALYQRFTLTIGLLVGFAMFFLVDVAILLQNKSQDAEIITSLSDVCDSLRIQLKGEVHITDALTECYLLTKNKRLKRAFERVESSMYLEHDLEKSLLDFRENFNNKYIDSFVITILQSEKSGKINQAMQDLASSFNEISRVLDNKRERRISSKLELLIISLVMWIAAVACYAIVVYLMKNSMSMWG